MGENMKKGKEIRTTRVDYTETECERNGKMKMGLLEVGIKEKMS